MIWSIKLPVQIRQLCAHFAQRRMISQDDTYVRRGESRLEKIKEDIYIGALAEHAAYEFLKGKVASLSSPDLSIKKRSEKKFSPDLASSTAFFHVKAQTTKSAQRYGFSWLFQMQDRLLNFPKPDEFFVFCSVSEHSEEVKILGIVKVKDIVDAKLVGVPKIPKYAITKKAIYWSDIEKSKIKMDWFSDDGESKS